MYTREKNFGSSAESDTAARQISTKNNDIVGITKANLLTELEFTKHYIFEDCAS